MGFPNLLGQSESVVNFQRRIELNRDRVAEIFGRSAVLLTATRYRGTTENPALAYKELQVVANDGTMQLPDNGLERFWINASGTSLLAHGGTMIVTFATPRPFEKRPSHCLLLENCRELPDRRRIWDAPERLRLGMPSGRVLLACPHAPRTASLTPDAAKSAGRSRHTHRFPPA